MFRRRNAGAEGGRDTIAVIRRLAALVDGGVPFSRGWEYLADGADLHQRTRDLLASLSRCAIDGGDVPAEILARTSPWPSRSADSWALTALCLHIALRSGAPMAACLRTVATVLTDAEDSGQDVRAALAGARSSTRVVMCLPIIGVGLAALMGFDLSGFLFGTVLGVGCLGVAALLMVMAWWWNGRLVQSAMRDTGDTGVGFELIAMAMLGGAAAQPAVQLVEESAEAFRAARIDIDSSRTVIQLSERAGVPARALLRSGAEDARAATRVRAKIRAATLSVRLLVPLGVCVLPSFALLSVVPLVATIISSTFAEW